MENSKRPIRNSLMEIGQTYFWTDSVNGWKHIFKEDVYKKVILSSLNYLVEKGKISVYGFVIMPNHLHLIWEINELNGKEMPNASFNKFTSHAILKDLAKRHPDVLKSLAVNDVERNYRFWQRDPLAVLLDSKEKAEQKLNYLHLNPLQSHWNLAKYPEEYYWSSARFYEEEKDEFGFLTHYMDRF